jgi:hypothetical protein
MFLIYGQFWNQTRLTWDWQQIGGVCLIEDDADQFAYGFAVSYGIPAKVIGRKGVRLYLPPVKEFLGQGQSDWPAAPDGSEVIVTH